MLKYKFGWTHERHNNLKQLLYQYRLTNSMEIISKNVPILMIGDYGIRKVLQCSYSDVKMRENVRKYSGTYDLISELKKKDSEIKELTKTINELNANNANISGIILNQYFAHEDDPSIKFNRTDIEQLSKIKVIGELKKASDFSVNDQDSFKRISNFNEEMEHFLIKME